MKVFVDHNLSHRLARALHGLFDGEHHIEALRDRFPMRTPDLEWIGTLGREGHWIVLSGDTRITRNLAERQAFLAARLLGVFMAPAVKNAPITKQLERILAVWASIEALERSLAGGALLELPINGSRVRQLKT